MPQEQPTKAMGKTSTTLSPFPKVALILGLISEWSRRDAIAALRATLMEVSKAKPRSVSERNAEFLRKMKNGL